jgi:DivIVA domain-containing protein
MEWYIAAIAVVALGVAAVVAAGGGGSMAQDPVRDTYAMTLPDGRLDGPTVRRLRFGVALRGYAMDQVDTVLDRVAVDLEARDARIAELEAQLTSSAMAPSASLPPSEAAPAAGWEQAR